CILCFRCVRVCDEGMDVKALGVGQRGSQSVIIPNGEDHLDCEECGMCIDICPVGALTSGTYRYKTRPWEMQHVGTICTHCSNGCKTTLGVRNDKVVRGNNRDRSGINGEFLCMKGRYAFDFGDHPERLQTPLVRKNGKLMEVAWSEALEAIAIRFQETKARQGKFGVIGSNHTTNEENYFLQKFARQALGTNNIDHHRTGDVVSLLSALNGRTDGLASTGDLYDRKAVLIIGSDLSQQHPFLAFQIRANYRHHAAHIYTVTPGQVRESKHSAASLIAAPGTEMDAVESIRAKLAAEPELVILFGDTIKGAAVRKLVEFGDSLGIPVKYVALVDYSNSRGASDMGLLPNLGPGYQPVAEPGLAYDEILAAPDLDVLWVVGANPLKAARLASSSAFVIVQEMFLKETGERADVILPAASAYEKNGTVTNVCGEVQRLKAGPKTMGTKPDLEIIGLLAKEMGVKDLGIWLPDKVNSEIRATVHGYNISLAVVASGGAAQTAPLNGHLPEGMRPDLIRSANDTLFTSGTLGRYSKMLSSILESPGALYQG
ncbi:MAG: molybdopterin-dependent oxidoreductase, partial [Bryobacteraceae bacterium]